MDIKVVSGEYAPGFGRITLLDNSVDCGPYIGYVTLIPSSALSVQDECANVTQKRHAAFENLEDPRIIGRCHIEDRLLKLEEPAWLFGPPINHPDSAPKVHTRISWTDNLNLHDRCPILGVHYCYKYLPAYVIHEMGHPAGLTDLYLRVFKGTWLDNDSYLMRKPGRNHEIPAFDIMYVNQVYRNEHGSGAHVPDDS